MNTTTRDKPWKGIILAGGAGTRLYPLTVVASKQMLPVYNKPMIYYPLSLLMLCGVREVLLISTPEDLPRYEALLGDGSRIGIQIHYAEQAAPNGIAEAFLLGEDFIDGHPVSLILGDNLFYGDFTVIRQAFCQHAGATIFGYRVTDPKRYGIVELDAHGKAVGIEEKPAAPKSPLAVPGLYCYDTDVVDIARNLRPSGRGELEITDVNRTYLEQGRLQVRRLTRGMAWFDMGTPDGLLDAANFIASVETRQGLRIGCIEEVAVRMGFISLADLKNLANDLSAGTYRDYLAALADEMTEAAARP